MKKRKVEFGARYRELPAKPALIERCDVSLSYFSKCADILGFNGDPSQYVLNPVEADISNLEVFRKGYWAAEMWSKFPFDIGVDRAAAAMQKFRDSETSCGETNKRLVDGWNRPWPEPVRRALKTARRNICKLLGDYNVEEVFAAANWGPGASSSLRRSKASMPIKWDAATHCTPDAEQYVYTYKLWCMRHLGKQTQVINCNRVTTVPKNAKTDRVIAVEPDWNMFFQKGVGECIRRRLNKVGLLLETEWVNSQSRNRDLARFGSETNTFGTIDLQAASDSVSLALCELLLPSAWYEAMFCLRSHFGMLSETEDVTYEKISSMGNGYTFELETLLFWGISTAIDEAGAICYGDDLVVANREIGLRLIELLEFCGFKVNPKKTFLDGPFRESCGGHYFNGIDVTPPYVRKPLDSLPRLISFGNALRRANKLDYLDPLFVDLWQEVKSSVPRRFRGPTSAGDICLHTRFDDCTPFFVRDWQCFAGEGLAGRVGREPSPERGAFIHALRTAAPGSQWSSDHSDYHVISQWTAAPWEDD